MLDTAIEILEDDMEIEDKEEEVPGPKNLAINNACGGYLSSEVVLPVNLLQAHYFNVDGSKDVVD